MVHSFVLWYVSVALNNLRSSWRERQNISKEYQLLHQKCNFFGILAPSFRLTSDFGGPDHHINHQILLIEVYDFEPRKWLSTAHFLLCMNTSPLFTLILWTILLYAHFRYKSSNELFPNSFSASKPPNNWATLVGSKPTAWRTRRIDTLPSSQLLPRVIWYMALYVISF